VFRIRIQSGQGIRNPDPYPGEQKRPTKIEKKLKKLSVGCSLLRAEGLDVLYKGLGIEKL
jgi:hypothetical protein